MKVIISYDLKRVKNYPRLYECLGTWGAQRLLESLWVADLVGPCPTIRDVLKAHVDADDALVIIEITPEADWATRNALPLGGKKLAA